MTDLIETLLVDRWASLSRRLEQIDATTLGFPEPAPTDRSLPSGEVGLDFLGPLGEGGMGVVRVAQQRSLGREVAVKEARGEEHQAALVREAWVAGQLEHPAIVPVHDLVFDGGPKLVMKRLHGRPWSDSITGAPPQNFGRDPIEANVRVLMRVCEALHFAHTRGVLHLDLKPENVILGEHGEVTLLDWGLALSLRPDTPLPPRESRTQVVGTLAYMAPEMLAAEGELLSIRTDVYLVGATLFEALAGHPPHGGATVLEVAYRIVHELPQLPDSAPRALAAVCLRAMAKEPGARFANVEELRLALEDALRHRTSERVAEQAQAAAQRLALARAAGEDGAVLQEGAAARFGFELALREWPGNPGAREGLLGVTEQLAHAAIDRGDLAVAEAHAGALADVPPDLEQRLAEAKAEARAARRRQAAAERAAADADPKRGRRSRFVFFGPLLVVFALIPLPMYLAPHWVTWPLYGAGCGVFATLAAALLVALRGPLSKSRANRQAAAAMAVNLLLQAAVVAGGWALGVPLILAPVLLFATWTASSGMYAGLAEPQLWPGPLLFGAFGVAAAVYPQHAFLGIAAANLLYLGLVLAVWRPTEG